MRILNLMLLILAGVSVSLTADYFLKNSHFNNYRLLAVGFLLYGLAAFPVAAAFRLTEFGIVFLVWEAMVVVLALSMGAILFKEPLTSLKLTTLFFAMLTLVLSYFASGQT